MNVKQVLEKTASEVPEKTAVILGSRRVTYRELNEASNKVANALIGLGVNRGDHVTILMSYTPEWLIHYFGVVKAAGLTVILNSMLTASEVASLLRDSDSEILLTEKKFSQSLNPYLSDIPLLKHLIEVDGNPYVEMIAKSSSILPIIEIEEEDETAIIYVPGVLGKQTGIVHTHSSLTGVLALLSSGIEQDKNDIVVSPIPFFYLLGLCIVTLGSILCGSTIVIIPRFTPGVILDAVHGERATIICCVPAMYEALAMLDDEILRGYDLSSLRLALTAGAKSSAHLMKLLEKRFGLTLCEFYGTSEALAVSFGDIHNRKLGTAGKPVCDIKIIDDSGAEVPQGEIGEAVVKAPWVMKGYYKAPELTAQVLKDGWFYSGDLVRMDEEGYLEYIEKKSFIIVTSAGVKIPPTEVEDVLLTHPSVAEVAYVGVMDELKGQIPTLFVVPKEGQHVTKQEIRSFCRQNLANYKLPHRIEFVESIPKTGSGKIDRKRLKEGKTS
ncbi:MAG: class I adenylate-forming enzyme family protein [Dehalococcoidia bacterium]